MRLKHKLITCPAFLCVLSGAFSQEVHYNYDRGANFSAYKTYQWVAANGVLAAPVPEGIPPAPSPSVPAPLANVAGGPPGFSGAMSVIPIDGTGDQLIDQEIKRAVDEQLALKGLVKVEKNGDIQVIYHAAIHQEQSISLSGSGGRTASGWWGIDSVQGQTSTISVGTLVVDLYDPARKQLVWRGDATRTVDLKKDPDKNYKKLQSAMSKLFKNYPPSNK